MSEYFQKMTTQVGNFLGELSAKRKITVALTGVAIVFGIVYVFMWAAKTTFQPLMTNLSNEDSARVIRILREKRIPFKVDDGGRTVSVPPESLYDVRFELATMGLPESSVVGYEVFDQTTLGTTSFVQKVNEKRAREGELMRTINTIKGVKRSRVHLVIPQRSPFVESQKKPTAAVVLDMEIGAKLTEKQVYGVQNLVARSVEGLEVADVMITSSTGKILSKNISDPVAASVASQLDFKLELEKSLEMSVENMLSKIVGEGKVVARVNAELDFSQISEEKVEYDADGSAIASSQKEIGSANGQRPGPYGAPGAQSNTPGQTPAVNTQTTTNTEQNREITNYNVPKTVRKTLLPTGGVKSLSVAVVMDGQVVREKDEEGNVLTKVLPWAPDKLKEFENLVGGALGLNEKRGDKIQVQNMAFNVEDFDAAERAIASREKQMYIRNLITYAVIGFAILMFFLFVVRPFIKWLTENTIESVDTFLPQTIEELEKVQKSQGTLPGMEEIIPVLPDKVDPEKVEGEMIKEKIVTLVDANPHKAAMIVRDWIHKKEEAQPTNKTA